jgi:hypothetical protein
MLVPQLSYFLQYFRLMHALFAIKTSLYGNVLGGVSSASSVNFTISSLTYKLPDYIYMPISKGAALNFRDNRQEGLSSDILTVGVSSTECLVDGLDL